MRTTIDLPDELLIAAKKRAAETRVTLREIFERGLRRELQQPRRAALSRRRPIRWVTAKPKFFGPIETSLGTATG
ncbi:MAG: hypothetical protein HYS04_00825 [Acidobacteria bacterium]|nr:hypothetical protein [Acidobacteriota bacterium]